MGILLSFDILFAYLPWIVGTLSFIVGLYALVLSIIQRRKILGQSKRDFDDTERRIDKKLHS